jgi:hypothetical protein
MTATPLRRAAARGLLLATLSALSFAAAQWAPQQAHATWAPAPLRQATSTGPVVQCPCNADLPQPVDVIEPSPVACPCNAGLPVRETAGVLPSATARRLGVARPAGDHRGGTFDWTAASVGAGVAAGVGLLVAGGALLLGRRRMRAVPAA